MKSFIVVSLIVLGMLTACSPASTSEQPIQVVQPTQQPAATVSTHGESTDESPSGSFVLVHYNVSGAPGSQNILARLYLDGSGEVCAWSLGNTGPWDRGESVLYFAPIEGNCMELDSRNLVIWYLDSNYAVITFEGQEIDEIPVWELVGSQYYKLPRKGGE